MPKVTVYVREADLPKWKALDKKTEFIHNALNRDVGARVKHLDKQLARVETLMVDNLAASLEPHLIARHERLVKNIVTNPKFCKHGADPNLCKFKKSGKPCK